VCGEFGVCNLFPRWHPSRCLSFFSSTSEVKQGGYILAHVIQIGIEDMSAQGFQHAANLLCLQTQRHLYMCVYANEDDFFLGLCRVAELGIS
jgi:hypothetical protein